MMINLVASGPLEDAKPLENKTFETKLGKLNCKGISSLLTLKGAAVDVNVSKVTSKDIVVRVRNYFNDKAPFGVVSSHMDGEFPDLGKGKSTGTSRPYPRRRWNRR